MADGSGTGPGNGHEDPLLVRRFVLDPHEIDGTSQPGHTWPEPSRHVPAHRARKFRVERADAVLPGVVSDDDTAGGGPSRRRVLLIAGLVVLVAIALAAIGLGVINGGDHGPRALPTASPPGAPDETAPGTLGTAPGSTPPAGPGQPGGQLPGEQWPVRAGPGTLTDPGVPATAPMQISPTTLAWTAQSSPPAEPRTGAIGTDGDRCLTVSGGKPHGQDKHARVARCDGTDGQVWTLAADGTIRLGGKCALAEDTGIRIAGCGRRPAAQWRAGPAGILLSVSTGECLTDAGDAVIARCTGSADQRWTLP